MAASLGGLDALVFTGGVGEGSALVRARVAEGLGFLGVEVDAGANEGVGVEGEVSAAGAAVRTLVVHAREDVEVARGVREVVGGGEAGSAGVRGFSCAPVFCAVGGVGRSPVGCAPAPLRGCGTGADTRVRGWKCPRYRGCCGHGC
ncbi:hypothetical protein HFP72_00050 [Nocardiopsis sp. ARC36]